MLRNSEQAYGWPSIALHWLVALVVIGQFTLGLWMVDLDYYDAWYQQAPAIHKGIGVLLMAVVLVRLVWRFVNPHPCALGSRRERFIAGVVHRLLYALLLMIMVSGYLISTADGRPIDVFGLFSVPATLHGIDEQEDIAGAIHEWLAWTLIGLVILHVLAAFKHHWIDRDATLRRMLGRQ